VRRGGCCRPRRHGLERRQRPGRAVGRVDEVRKDEAVTSAGCTLVVPPPPLPDGRVLIAFDGNTLEWDATFTAIDNHPSLVTRHSIDRGRQFEMDRTDTGRATVEIADKDGLLDPTNSPGPYYTRIEPL